MATTVLNTLTGAVTEYTGFSFQSVTPTHAGSTLGLFAFGGTTDAGRPIVSTIETGKKNWGSANKKFVDVMFFAMKGTGSARGIVNGETTKNAYNFRIEKHGESRCQPGRGIRENYLSFGLTNPSGEPFELDRIEARIGTSGTRRTQ